MTTISDSALLMGCRCSSRFNAPPMQSAPKMKKITRYMPNAVQVQGELLIAEVS